MLSRKTRSLIQKSIVGLIMAGFILSNLGGVGNQVARAQQAKTDTPEPRVTVSPNSTATPEPTHTQVGVPEEGTITVATESAASPSPTAVVEPTEESRVLNDDEIKTLTSALDESVGAILKTDKTTGKYDFWHSELNGKWVEVDLWYLDENSQPVPMTPLVLFAKETDSTTWKIFSPWNVAEFNAALDILPSAWISQARKEMLRIPESSQVDAQSPTEAPIGQGGFLFPWAGNKLLTQNASSTGVGGDHAGNEIDIGNSGIAFDILAPKDGVVIWADFSSTLGGDCANYESATNYVVLGHGRATGQKDAYGKDVYPFYTLYYHLAYEATPPIHEGDRVKVGQRIGTSGTTGWSTGVHLHFTLTNLPVARSNETVKYCSGVSYGYNRSYPYVSARNSIATGFQENGNLWPLANGQQIPYPPGTPIALPLSWNHLGLNSTTCDPNNDPVIVYKHRDFGGECEVFGTGSDSDLGNNYIGNDSISSVLIQPGYTAVLYDNVGFGLPKLVLDVDTADFSSTYAGDWNDRASSIQVLYGVCVQAAGELSSQCASGNGSGNDTTPPSGSWATPNNGSTINSRTVTLTVNASDNSGGSGVREVRFSAAWGGQWHGLGNVSGSPYSINWNWCDAGVPDGDVELGFEVWDNANNQWVYSQHSSNFHITKNFSCDNSGGVTPGGAWNTQAWQNHYLAGYTNWEGTFTWDNGNYPYVSFNWGNGAPFGWGGDDFSMRLWRNVYFPGGYYSFHSDHDDGVRVYLDGNLMIDAWWDGHGGHDAGRNIPAGNHEVKVEYYENTGDALLNVWWYGPGYPQPDNNPPDGRITSPQDGAFTSDGILNVSADASDDVSGVDHVEFWVWLCDATCGWQSLGTDYSAPYQTTFDWSGRGDGQYTLSLTIWDKTGKVRYDAGGWVVAGLDRSDPEVTITSPVTGENLASLQSIQVLGSDETSGIGKVQFFAGYSDTSSASLQGTQAPPPALTKKGDVSSADVSAQDYWHEIGWDEDGSDGWSLNWDTSSVPEQAGVAVFVYAYDKAGNYTGTAIWNVSAYRPPSNDDFDSPIQISSNSYTNQQTTYNATSAADDPALTSCNRTPGEATVWYQFTPSADGQLSVDTDGSDYDTMLAVWSGARGSLNMIDCNDDRPSDLQSALDVNVSNAVSYYIEVAHYAGPLDSSLGTQSESKPKSAGQVGTLSGGTLQLNMTFAQADLTITGLSAPASNPAADQPFDVTVSVTNQGTGIPPYYYVDIYVDRQPTGCNDYGDYSAWAFDPASGATQQVIVSSSGFLTDGLSQGSHQIWAYVDSGCEVGESNDSNNQFGPITINVGAALPTPANDDINSPKTVQSMPYTDIMAANGATVANDDPAIDACGLNPGRGSVWYQFTPHSTGAFSIDTIGSNYDTVLAIWTGSRGALAPVGCNDDVGYVNGIWVSNSKISVPLTAGNPYYVEVMKFGAYETSGLSAHRTPGTKNGKPPAGDLGTLSGGSLQLHITAPVVSTTFQSTGAYDGFVLESSEKSNAGGTINAGASTFNLGDTKTRQQYRGILSFSTGAGLPDAAVITSVMLKLRMNTIAGGGNPLTTFQGFMVDIKKGIFGTTGLQATDFQTAASKSYGPFMPDLVSNWYTIDLTGGTAYVNKLATASGLTQIRLRFKLDDNNNAVANYLSLFSGNAPAANRPQLIINYYMP